MPSPHGRGAATVWALLVTAAVAMATSGCGAGSLLPVLGGGGRDPGLQYAACMRAHGVPDFPDPSGGSFQTSEGSSTTAVNGVTLKESTAQVQTADAACQRNLGPRTGGGPASPQQQQAALAYAQCMRAHGIPNFPDPKVTADSFITPLKGTGIDPHSPQFQAAQSACQSLQPQI